MSETGKQAIRGVAVLVTIGLIVSSAGAALASHFRGSEASFTVSGGIATWILQSAWATDSADSFAGSVGSLVEVTQLTSATDAVGTGAGTGTFLEVTAQDFDSSFNLYDLTTETLEGDLSALGDGIYEIFLSSCCRISGIENSPDSDFSQWVRFTKTGSVYDIAPLFTAPVVYAVLSPSGQTVLDFTAIDSTAVTYAFADLGSPELGATELACSTFSGGILTVGPAQCTGGDVYTDIYLAGTFWVVKVVATDAQGNESVTDTLLRVLSPPDPHIGDHEFVGNGTAVEFDVYAEDTIVDDWTVTCEGVGDPTDVVVGTSAASPVLLQPLTIGEEYVCEVTAVNAAGSATSVDGYTIGPVVLDGVEIVTDLAVGDFLAGSTVQLVGSNLMALSAYTLDQLPTPGELTSGAADGDGAFSDPFEIPASACVVGSSSLVLTGVGLDGTPRTDTVWYALDTNCQVTAFSRLGPIPSGGGGAAALPPTGSAVDMSVPAGALVAMLIGLGLVLSPRIRNRVHVAS